jgi:hypothetical protein
MERDAGAQVSTSPAEERDLAPSPPRSPQRVGLTPLDRAAAVAFAGGSGISALVDEAQRLAEDLAGPDGDRARVQLLARATSATRIQQQVLEVMIGDRLAKRDLQGVELVDRVLEGVSRRLGALLRQLAAESALAKRPSVLVHATEVTINDRDEP